MRPRDGARSIVRPRFLAVAVGLGWLVAVCAGLAVLLSYENTPGLAATPPAQWPASSRLERASGGATLVMLLHPGCPCSRASIEELDTLMARCQGLLTTYVLFFKPRDFADDWVKTGLWARAAAIPGVRLERDDDGVEAGRFRASTSGQVVLYDASGALLFSGGITQSRGHAGDSDGRGAIVALLTGEGARTMVEAPVFGCSLHDPNRDPLGPVNNGL